MSITKKTAERWLAQEMEDMNAEREDLWQQRDKLDGYDEMENDAYWAKEERDKLQVDIDVRNIAAEKREKGLRRQQEEANKKAADIIKMITRLKAECLSTSLIQIEVEEAFDIKRSRFYDILKTM